MLNTYPGWAAHVGRDETVFSSNSLPESGHWKRHRAVKFRFLEAASRERALPTQMAARPEKGGRRVEPGLSGVESETHGHPAPEIRPLDLKFSQYLSNKRKLRALVRKYA
jgi:hypothetical protein